MTKPEITNNRDLTFSKWIRVNLPDSSTGFCVSDLDFMLWNYKTQRFMMLEVKTNNARMPAFQRMMLEKLNDWIKAGIQINGKGWKYYGFHVVIFERYGFHDGRCFLNNVPVTEEQLRKFLSLE